MELILLMVSLVGFALTRLLFKNDFVINTQERVVATYLILLIPMINIVICSVLLWMTVCAMIQKYYRK